MATLHVLANPAALASCLRALAPADRLLLLGDGARAAHALAAASAAAHAARVGVLGEGAPTTRVEPLSYDDFVGWVVACERSVTWT